MTTNNIVLDASAWLEYFFGTEKGMKVRAHLAKAGSFVPITGVTVAEVCKRYIREGKSTEPALTALKAITTLVSFDYALGLETANIAVQQRKQHPKFSTADAHVVALARKHRAKIITCDTDFLGIPEAIIIK